MFLSGKKAVLKYLVVAANAYPQRGKLKKPTVTVNNSFPSDFSIITLSEV